MSHQDQDGKNPSKRTACHSRKQPVDSSMRKTKIICTLGPASDSDVVIGDLMLAGADIFRLNMSHARHDWVRDVVKRIRRIAMGLDVNCAILLDTHLLKLVTDS